MKTKKILQEIKQFGQYQRGDCWIGYKNGLAQAKFKLKNSALIKKFLPDLPAEISQQIFYPASEKIAQLSQLPIQVKNKWLIIESRGKSVREAIGPIVKFLNQLYPRESAFKISPRQSAIGAKRICLPDVHITKRSGAYVLVLNERAVYVTQGPFVEECPLRKTICQWLGIGQCPNLGCECRKIVNRKIKKLGMFTNQRVIKGCGALVPFGASEIIMDAMKKKMIEAVVMVCEGVGTVVVTNPEYVQGIGAAMTGVFYTSPKKKLIEKFEKDNVLVVFPLTAEINQLAGLEMAIERGYRRIAVMVAGEDNSQLAKFKKKSVEIVILSLCLTGIKKRTAQTILNHADLVWGCASKYIRQLAPQQSLIQLGLKIPVWALTKKSWQIVRNRLINIDPSIRPKIKKLKLNRRKQYYIAHQISNKLQIGLIKDIDENSIDKPRPLL